MKEIQIKSLNENVFSLIGDRWMLVGATDKTGKSNAMTASWGGLGVLWGKNVAFVFIRPQRYTKKFVDDSDKLTLSFFDEDQKSVLGYMGKVSGANEDKMKNCGLCYNTDCGAPVFDKAVLTLVCKKLYCQKLEEQFFIEKENVPKWYKDKDFHYMYVVEIEKALQN